MIVLDIETTGLTHDCAICEIGAINLEDASQFFVQDCRIDEKYTITDEALGVNGRTREELFDPSKQTQKQMIENYLDWVEKQPIKMFYGQNVGWDISMIQAKCEEYGIKDRFRKVHSQRSMEIHTLAQIKYKKINGDFLLDGEGKSAMNLARTLEFCGMEDNRKAHNALEDCKLEGEVVYRLEEGINWHPDYAKYKVPDYLKK